eukprot:COSAG02_NODE_43677_length_372_cov_1.597070_1_plen_22_part_10
MVCYYVLTYITYYNSEAYAEYT